MATHPFILLPPPAVQARRALHGGGGGFRKPTPEQQRQRLDDRFQQIARSFTDIQVAVQGLEPEQVIVLETIGQSVEGLAAAAARIPGLEWLAERDLGEAEPVGGFEAEQDPMKKLPVRLYALFSNQQAMNDLIALWRSWYTNPDQRAKRHFGPFKGLFVHLKDIRRWSVQDRIAETKVLAYWEDNLTIGRERVVFEIELWPRADPGRRARAYETLSGLVNAEDGRCLVQTAIREILYHGVLAELPATALRETVNRLLKNQDTQLLRCEEVMFFRAFAQSLAPPPSEQIPAVALRERMRTLPLPTGVPVAALLDGLPLEQHEALAGRMIVDDPDGHGQVYQPGQQCHGTAMASLIVHGDLGADENAISRPLYVRSIYCPFIDFDGNYKGEGISSDRLLVDVLHRAVRRIKEGDAGQAAVAPSVIVINLSFGNVYEPFDRNLSPLARLLDWLSWKYNILFLVSAGNQPQDIPMPLTRGQWAAMAKNERVARALKAMRDDQLFRRPFSPAEAVNALTVGAIHADESGPVPETDIRIDLLGGERLPAPFSTVASGFNRSVKPELFLPGGRQLFRPQYGGVDGRLVFSTILENPVGQLAACPGQRPLELDRLKPCCGTSDATALGTRSAHFIYDRLQEMRNEPGGDRLSDAYAAVLLKALLVHGASWGSAADKLDDVFGDLGGRELLRLKSRFLGYGELALQRSLFCTNQRVTLLGWGEIRDEDGHVYEVPLPPSLSATTIRRRLTITLAWLTPINPRHRDYRRSYLWFHVPEEVIGVSKKDLDFDSSRRGTVQHRVLEGEEAAVFIDGDVLRLTVSCKAAAGLLGEETRYGLAITVETAEATALNIYEEILLKIRPPVPVVPEA